MYDEHARLLRLETVVNQPREFEVRRLRLRRGRRIARRTPTFKAAAFLDRTGRIRRAANERYLAALPSVEDPDLAHRTSDRTSRPAGSRHRPHRELNAADHSDAKLRAAVVRGEDVITGFRNRHVREALFGATTDRTLARRRAARVGLDCSGGFVLAATSASCLAPVAGRSPHSGVPRCRPSAEAVKTNSLPHVPCPRHDRASTSPQEGEKSSSEKPKDEMSRACRPPPAPRGQNPRPPLRPPGPRRGRPNQAVGRP